MRHSQFRLSMSRIEGEDDDENEDTSAAGLGHSRGPWPTVQLQAHES
jgi:hypothetical protein